MFREIGGREGEVIRLLFFSFVEGWDFDFVGEKFILGELLVLS